MVIQMIKGASVNNGFKVTLESKFILLTILSICFLATGGIFVKLSSLPPIATAFYRILFSIPILYPFVKTDLIKTSKKDRNLISLAGIFLALDLIFWNISFHLTTVANANLLANLVPFTVIPVSYFLYKKRLSKVFVIGLFITLIGLVVLMSGKLNPNINNFKGDMLAFITSIFYGLFLLVVSNIRKRINAMTIIFISGFGGGLTLFIAMYMIEGLHYPKNINEILPLVGLALVSQILGQGLLSYCIGKIDITLSSVLVLSQPIIAALYSYFIFRENLTFQEIFGILIVLIGIYLAKIGNNN